MKNTIKLALGLCTVTALIITACKYNFGDSNSENTQELSSSKIESINNYHISLNDLLNTSKESSNLTSSDNRIFTVQYDKYGIKKKYKNLYQAIDHNNFRQIVSMFTPSENIVYAVFYAYNEDPESVSIITPNTISGASIFYINGNKMFHKLFVNDHNTLVENSSYSIESNIIVSSDLEHILMNITGVNNAKSFIEIKDVSFTGSTLSSSRSFMMLKEAAFCKNWIDNNPARPKPNPNEGCGGLCIGGNEDDVCDHLIAECSGGCMGSSSALVLANANNEIAKNFLFPQYYDLRNNLFSQNYFGYKYKLYFRSLSLALADDIDLSLAVTFANALPEINKASYIVLDKNNLNDIVITNEVQNNVLDVLHLLRKKNYSEDYSFVLDDLKKDIIEGVGKNAQTVRTKFAD